MGVRDVNVDWLRKHKFIRAKDFLDTLVEGGPNTQTNPGNGTPVWTRNINSLGIEGWLLDTDEDEVITGPVWLPFDMDPDFPLKLTAHCLTKTNTGSVMTFAFTFNNVKSAEAVALPTTATDVACSSVTAPATAYRAYKVTGAEIAADTWTRAEIEAGHFINLGFKNKTHAGTIGTESIYVLGIELSYVPQMTRGAGSRADHDSYT